MRKSNKWKNLLLLGSISGALGYIVKKRENSKLQKLKHSNQSQIDKLTDFYFLLLQWLELKQNGKSAVTYFRNHHYHSVAIYGMKELGERLVSELKDTDIEVRYGIDRNAGDIYSELPIMTPGDTLEPVDVIVVTAVSAYEEIKSALLAKTDCPIVSLEDILYEV